MMEKSLRTQQTMRSQVTGPASSVPYDFSALVGTQVSFQETNELDDTVTKFIPFRRWFIDEKTLRPELQFEGAVQEYIGILRSGTVRTRKVNNRWCIASFEGAEVRERQNHGIRTELSRTLPSRLGGQIRVLGGWVCLGAWVA